MTRINNARVMFWVRHWTAFQTRLYMVWRRAIALPVSEAGAQLEDMLDPEAQHDVDDEHVAGADGELQQSDSEEGHTAATTATVKPPSREKKRLRESRRTVTVTPASQSPRKKARADSETPASSPKQKAATKASQSAQGRPGSSRSSQKHPVRSDIQFRRRRRPPTEPPAACPAAHCAHKHADTHQRHRHIPRIPHLCVNMCGA
jgi:hypothetical protein